MRFSRIRLENWRNFSDVDVALQNRAFLIGANASGKSNFLDVFRFLRDLVLPGGGFQASVERRGGVSRLRNLAARHPSTDVVIDVTFFTRSHTEWRYRIAFGQDNRRQAVLKTEKIWEQDRVKLERPDEADRQDGERLKQTYLEQTFANREFRDITEVFSAISYWHVVPQLIRDTERTVALPADPFGSDLLEQVAKTSQKIRDARLRHIQDALKIAIPQLSELQLERDERGRAHLKGRYEHWRPHGAWQNETDFSDGTLRLIGLVWALLDGDGPLLLEEPELSLHPGVVQFLPQMMNRITRRRKQALRQVFISTHSRELLTDEGIAPDEVLLLHPSERGTEITVGLDDEMIRHELGAGLSMAEVVMPRTEPEGLHQLLLWGQD